MFPKIRIASSKELDEKIEKCGGAHLVVGLFTAMELITILLRRHRVLFLGEQQQSDICRSIACEAARAELFITTGGKKEKGLRIDLFLWKKGRQKTPFAKAIFRVNNDELRFVELQKTGT